MVIYVKYRIGEFMIVERLPWLHLSQHGLEGLADIVDALVLLQR